MKCAWQKLLSVLPQHIRGEVDNLSRDDLQEVRLRLDEPVQLVTEEGLKILSVRVTAADISFVVNAASRYSPWAAESAASGYVTAPGGHRIGLCGQCTLQNGVVTGIREVTSLCVRVARECFGVAVGVPNSCSVLILGPPGSGKTTLLRDLIRIVSDRGTGSVSVVDERGELFPREADFDRGKQTDVLTGCDKASGIDMVLRTMGPRYVAVDEITNQNDCQALIRAGWCGVKLMATAHATDLADLRQRPVYRPLIQTGLFDTVVVLKPDKSWRVERVKL